MAENQKKNDNDEEEYIKHFRIGPNFAALLLNKYMR